MALLEAMLDEDSSPGDEVGRRTARRFAAEGYEALAELLTEMQLDDEAVEADEARRNAKQYRRQLPTFDRRP